ncbi:MAG: DUF3891 family protein [Alphaproteobacteria bacterium]
MVVRDLKDGRSIVSTQEDHADLAAQFAAHWGNERFAKLRPYHTMLLATTYHDSGYREWEGNPPMNMEKGRPYAFREEIPGFESVELAGYLKNVDWVSSHGLYAGLLVSMHRTGLWQNRYNVFTEPAMKPRERSSAVQAVKKQLEEKQARTRRTLARDHSGFEQELWHNFAALQIFDLLSLYFCCDGFATENSFKEYKITPVGVDYNSEKKVDLRIVPNGSGTVRMEPYPFDISPLRVAIRARVVIPPKGKTEKACVEAYHKAPRQLLEFKISK